MTSPSPTVQTIYERVWPFPHFYSRARRQAMEDLNTALSQIGRLEEIAWHPEPAGGVRQILLQHGPRAYAVRRTIDKLMEGTFYYLAIAWLSIFVPLAFAAVGTAVQSATTVTAVSGVIVLAAEALLLFGGLGLERRWARADAPLVACVAALVVLELADRLAKDPTNSTLRRELAERIAKAASTLSPEVFFPTIVGTKAAKKRTLKHLARASDALRSFGEVALCGGPTSLNGLAEDFGRATLRVASGNWDQIANLRPGTPPEQQPVSPFFREVVLNVVKVAVPALIGAAVTLASKIGDAPGA